MREHAGLLLERARRRAATAVRQGLLAIEVERHSLALSSEQLEQRLAALRERLAEMRLRRDEVEDHLGADVRRLVVDTLEPYIAELRRHGTARVRAAVEAEAGRDGPQLTHRVGGSRHRL